MIHHNGVYPIVSLSDQTCDEINNGVRRYGEDGLWQRRSIVIMGDHPILPGDVLVINKDANITASDRSKKIKKFAVNAKNVSVICACDVEIEVARRAGYDTTNDFREAFTSITIASEDSKTPLRVDPQALVTVVDFDRPKPVWRGVIDHIISHNKRNLFNLNIR